MKKLLTLIVISVIATLLIAEGTSKQYYTTGITSDDWVEVLSLDNSRYGNLVITIDNTGSNDISWRVKGYAFKDATAYYIIASGTTLSDGDDPECIEQLPCGFPKITVEVKTTTAGNTSNYRIDYCIKNEY